MGVKATCNTTSLSIAQNNPHFINNSAMTRLEGNLLPKWVSDKQEKVGMNTTGKRWRAPKGFVLEQF